MAEDVPVYRVEIYPRGMYVEGARLGTVAGRNVQLRETSGSGRNLTPDQLRALGQATPYLFESGELEGMVTVTLHESGSVSVRGKRIGD